MKRVQEFVIKHDNYSIVIEQSNLMEDWNDDVQESVMSKSGRSFVTDITGYM